MPRFIDRADAVRPVRRDARQNIDLVKWQQPGPGGEHSFVAPAAMAEVAPSQYGRPVPTSNTKLIQRGQLGNIRFELPINADCGYSDPLHLVVCLDQDYRITATESLRVLSFASDPVRVVAGSPKALAVINDFLYANAPKAQAEFVSDAACVGACERRITLELQ